LISKIIYHSRIGNDGLKTGMNRRNTKYFIKKNNCRFIIFTEVTVINGRVNAFAVANRYGEDGSGFELRWM
jgi:hypothetical protein